jgi:hypothetical protein
MKIIRDVPLNTSFSEYLANIYLNILTAYRLPKLLVFNSTNKCTNDTDIYFAKISFLSNASNFEFFEINSGTIPFINFTVSIT